MEQHLCKGTVQIRQSQQSNCISSIVVEMENQKDAADDLPSPVLQIKMRELNSRELLFTGAT